MNVEQVRREGNERSKKDKITWNWLRNRNTIEFLGIWEQLNNPDFKPVEFDGIRIQTGLNSFTLTPKQWIEISVEMKIGQMKLLSADKISSANPQIRADYFGMNSFSSLQVVGDLICQI